MARGAGGRIDSGPAQRGWKHARGTGSRGRVVVWVVLAAFTSFALFLYWNTPVEPKAV